MASNVDGFEQSARIVEAFTAGQSPVIVGRLTYLAQMIREHERGDDGFERSAFIAESFAAAQSGDQAEIVREIAQAIRDRAVDD